jgi:hypothetical protein
MAEAAALTFGCAACGTRAKRPHAEGWRLIENGTSGYWLCAACAATPDAAAAMVALREPHG